MNETIPFRKILKSYPSKFIFMNVFFLMMGAVMSNADDKIESQIKTKAFDIELLNPFWKNTLMKEESLFFAERVKGQLPTATLLFPPEKIESVKSANGEIIFEEGKDFTVDKVLGVLTLLSGTKIPNKKLEEMYLPKDSTLPKYGYKRGDPNTFFFFF